MNNVDSLRCWFYKEFGENIWKQYISNIKAENKKQIKELLEMTPRENLITALFNWHKTGKMGFWGIVQERYEKRKYIKKRMVKND